MRKQQKIKKSARPKGPGRGRKPGDKGRKEANPGACDRQLARAARAFDLASQGRSMRAIAAELGISVGAVHADIERIRKELRSETLDLAGQQRDLDLELIGKLVERWSPLALAQGLDISKDVPSKRGLRHIELDAFTAAGMATDKILRLIERRAKLLGMDAAVKVEETAAKLKSPEETLSLAREAIKRLGASFAPRAVVGQVFE